MMNSIPNQEELRIKYEQLKRSFPTAQSISDSLKSTTYETYIKELEDLSILLNEARIRNNFPIRYANKLSADTLKLLADKGYIVKVLLETENGSAIYEIYLN